MKKDGTDFHKRPIEIRVYWDNEFKKGQEYADLIFHNFSQNEEVAYEYNLGIPVYFFNNPIFELDNNRSNHIICFIFIDDNFIINKNKWEHTLNNLTNEQTSKTISIIPVKFSEYAYSFFDQFSLLNFIIPENKTKNDKFLLAVAYSIYLCLFNKNSFNKVSMPLFLSHCKKSDGLRVCKNIKEYLANNKSPISIFFDENDIYFGERFDIKIEENIKKSTLVIIHSDGFSSREFCKREVLLAKQYERPIVLIDYLQNGENRLFPYLGNIRTIKIEKNINYFKLLFEIIKESIRIEFFRQKNNMIISIFNPKHLNYKLIPYAPELLTISFSTNKKEIIIYPNPLLGNEELKLLESQFPNKRFLTPILFAISSKKYISMLNNVSISFSVSETDKMKTSHDVLYGFR